MPKSTKVRGDPCTIIAWVAARRFPAFCSLKKALLILNRAKYEVRAGIDSGMFCVVSVSSIREHYGTQAIKEEFCTTWYK